MIILDGKKTSNDIKAGIAQLMYLKEDHLKLKPGN
jgi:hypothetical protein